MKKYIGIILVVMFALNGQLFAQSTVYMHIRFQGALGYGAMPTLHGFAQVQAVSGQILSGPSPKCITGQAGCLNGIEPWQGDGVTNGIIHTTVYGANDEYVLEVTNGAGLKTILDLNSPVSGETDHVEIDCLATPGKFAKTISLNISGTSVSMWLANQ